MLKTIRKHGITLALFAAGSTGLTAAINQMTKTTIAEQASLQQKALFDPVRFSCWWEPILTARYLARA